MRSSGRRGRAEGGLWPRPGSVLARPGKDAVAGPGSGVRAAPPRPRDRRDWSPACRLRGRSESPAPARPFFPPSPVRARALLVPTPATSGLPGRGEPWSAPPTAPTRNARPAWETRLARGSLPALGAYLLKIRQAELLWNLGQTPLNVTQSRKPYC